MRPWLLAGLLLASIVSAPLAFRWQADALQAEVLDQINRTGLAELSAAPSDADELLSSPIAASGRILLGDRDCATSCPEIQVQGIIQPGFAPAVLRRRLAMAQADYRVELSVPGLQPQMPVLQLQAVQPLTGTAHISLDLPAATHDYDGTADRWQIAHAGLEGHLRSGELSLSSAALRLGRNDQNWVDAGQLQLQISQAGQLLLKLDSASLLLPALGWSGGNALLDYQHRPLDSGLQAKLLLGAGRGRTAASGGHAPRSTPPVNAQLDIARLDHVAAWSLLSEGQALMASRMSSGIRALGWLRLYGRYGPHLLTSQPSIALKARELPWPQGGVDIDLELAVLPDIGGLPLSVRQWLGVLRGELQLVAPPAVLSGWLADHGRIARQLGLPGSVPQLRAAGWLHPRGDGRDELHVRIVNAALQAVPRATGSHGQVTKE